MMRKMVNYVMSGLVVMLIIFPSCSNEKQDTNPPVAEKIPYKMEKFGIERVDNYYWMRLTEEQRRQENPDPNVAKVLDYLNAENAYTQVKMKHTEPLQEKLYNEMVGRIKQEDESVPYFENGYYYYNRTVEGGEYPIYCRKKGNLEAKEEILLDVNEMAKGYNYFSVAGLNVSPDNQLLAYGVDTVSRRRYTIYFKNLETGELLADEIANTTGSLVWANDNKTVFYTSKDLVTLRADRIMKHKPGTDVAQDKEIFFEADETFSTGISKTKSKKYLMIYSSQTISTEYRFLDAGNPDGEFKIIQPRMKNLEYQVDHFGDHFYIVTNADGATNFKLVKAPVAQPGKDNWKEVIPHRSDVLLARIEIYNDYIVLEEKAKALDHLRIINWKTGDEHYLDFGEEVYTAGISVNPEFDTKLLRYGYSSLTTPYSTIDYNMETKEKDVLKETEVLGGFDKNNYEAKRLWATANDGTKIPISLVYRKGVQKEGGNPLFLYAYGSYGSSTEPYFNSFIISLLDRGFVYAIAHVRGGSDMGRPWYEDGKLLKKINTFTDFNDCAEFLINEKYTKAEKLFAYGGSAGGLLMGAIVNMQPELYKGVIAAVPFVDVVTTMLDETIPLTTFEYDEWGNPNVEEYFNYMLSYSPYDNVKAQNYPNLLVTTGLHDSQVQYWEPAKWVAKLRDMKTDEHLLLLKTNMEAGHGGASGRFRRIKERAFQYAFVLDLAGITE